MHPTNPDPRRFEEAYFFSNYWDKRLQSLIDSHAHPITIRLVRTRRNHWLRIMCH